MSDKTMEQYDLIRELSQLVPPDRLLHRRGDLAAFETDGLTVFQAQPRAVVIVDSIDEIAAVLKWCQKHKIPYVPRGSGTSLSGGCMPNDKGIVIAMNRMNRVLSVDPVQRIAVVESGTINSEVSRAASRFGLQYAPDPSSQQVCTIGGNLAFNAGGAHCLKYGMTSNHVLGAKVVLPDGEVVELGSNSCEQVGPDLMGMFVGGEGLLGVAVEVTLRLTPVPEAFYTVLAGYDSLQKAGDAVSTIIAAGLLPAAMEIMDPQSMSAATQAVGVSYPQNAEAVLIVELDGAQEFVDQDQIRLDELLKQSGASEIQVAADAEQRATIWKGRKSVFSAVGLLSPDFLVQDCVVPRNRLGEALVNIQELSRQHHIDVANVFHAGDGNLHPLIMFDGREEGQLERAEAVSQDIIRMCIELGGSITGEHGVGMEKRQYLAEMYDRQDVEFMKQIRRIFDPAEVANRGKMFPEGEAPALRVVGLHPLEKAGIASRM